MYTKYLTDCAQRNAFLETRRSIETRYKIEKENGKQVGHGKKKIDILFYLKIKKL